MKKLISQIILATIILTGCNKFLDVAPTTDVTIPSTLTDYKSMMYPMNMVYGYNVINNLMGDDVYFSKYLYETQPAGMTEKRAYLYEPEIYDITITPTTWSDHGYYCIFTMNKVINEIRNVKGEEMSALIAVEAEARLYRAYQYFHLVNTFAKPYQMATDTDPGIPVTDKNDVMNNDRQRTPLKEVYKYILNDLDSAIKYLPNFTDKSSRFIGTKISAYSLKAKVLFYMCEYSKALTEVENALAIINGPEKSAVGITYRFIDYRTELSFIDPTKPWKGLKKTFPVYIIMESVNYESIMTRMVYSRDPAIGTMSSYPRNCVFVSDMAIALFDKYPGDLRKSFMLFDKNSSGEPWDVNEPTRYLKRNYWSNAGVSYPEIILIAAECYARAGNTTKALQYLNALRVNRYTNADYIELNSSDKNTVIKWVLEERIREFIAQGHRWWDIRRLWDDPVGGPMIVKTRTLDGKTYTLTKDRLTLRIPEYIMQFNPDWKQND
jgi:tetratricopeptide (TPR) repeat protein